MRAPRGSYASKLGAIYRLAEAGRARASAGPCRTPPGIRIPVRADDPDRQRRCGRRDCRGSTRWREHVDGDTPPPLGSVGHPIGTSSTSRPRRPHRCPRPRIPASAAASRPRARAPPSSAGKNRTALGTADRASRILSIGETTRPRAESEPGRPPGGMEGGISPHLHPGRGQSGDTPARQGSSEDRVPGRLQYPACRRRSRPDNRHHGPWQGGGLPRA